MIPFFLAALFAYAYLFFFQSISIDNFGNQKLLWEILLSVSFGAFFDLLLETRWFKKNFIRAFSDYRLLLLAVSFLTALLLTVYSRSELSDNPLTAAHITISAAEADGKSVYIQDIILDHRSVSYETQCRLSGNVTWDGDHPILQGASPAGRISCTGYPRFFGKFDQSLFEVNLVRRSNGGIAYFSVNGDRNWIDTQRFEKESPVFGVPLSIPLSAGVALAKGIEFLDTFFITLGVLIFVPYTTRNQLRRLKALGAVDFSWRNLLVMTFLCVSAYTLLEWFFIITKPSYLSAASIGQRVGALLVAIAFFAGILFLIELLAFLLSFLPFLRRIRPQIKRLALFLPVFVLASLALLLIDNFTYTVFGQGIPTSESYQRFFYFLLFVYLLVQAYPRANAGVCALENALRGTKWNFWLFPILAAFLVITVGLANKQQISQKQAEISSLRAAENRLPDILILTADGVNATQTSIYGDPTGTTPFISDLAETSLVAENAFSNSGNTSGSLVSMYTSKYPMQTRLLYPPDILHDEDSYQHLPGILKSLGYYSLEFGAPRYADAFDLNVIAGFDIVNGRSIQNSVLFSQLNRMFPTNHAYLVYELLNRIFDRLGHITFLSEMANNQALVEGEVVVFDDQSKVDRVLAAMRQSEQPVFAHIHWMGTHAARFAPEYESDSHINDDNIRAFDASVGKIIAYLKATKEFDNTLLIIGSDHGRMYFTNKRIPLILHFPDDEFASRRTSNVEYMDVAPTILDYLDVKKPDWMRGTSFLRHEEPDRLIFGTGVPNEIRNIGFVASEYMKPPFFQFGYIGVVHCDDWYRFDFSNQRMTSGVIQGHTHPCSADERISDEKIWEQMKAFVSGFGFDISALQLNNHLKTSQ